MSRKEIDALRRAGHDTGHSEFAERLVRALGENIRALEALPRDDEFRRGWADLYALEALARTGQGAAARAALRILRTPGPLPGPC
ncbi:hypothetical protein [Streptomyces yangpuensis]|uniref:hypothetical protein n=1 Tax=Streptomyces yangpuensis TaxID=1648182 RepID=UPI0006296D89|nr:hypothetical protein [Streptomyces yangpuensis]